MYKYNEDQTANLLKTENLDKLTLISEDQRQWSSTFDRLFYSYQRYNELRRRDDAIKERFNDLQNKLHELDILHQSSDEFHRTGTPLSRDSGIPVRSSSSCCSITSESASTPKSSIDVRRSSSPQTSVLQFFLHPPDDQHRHVTVHLSDSTRKMPFLQDSIPFRYRSQGGNICWNEQPIQQFNNSSTHPRRSSSYHTFQRDYSNSCYNSDSSITKTMPKKISLNASLPFQTKLNIHIHADQSNIDKNKENSIKATAEIEQLTETTLKPYLIPYSKQESLNQHEIIINKSEKNSLTHQRESRRDKLPRHRQVSLPMSLPIDQRLYLYIRNGEVLARC